MTPNFFAIFKVIALLLAEDKVLHPKERAWFFALACNHGATFLQRLTLNKYLHGRATEHLDDILIHIDKEDHQRLLNFLRVGMRQDGVVTNSELTFYHRVQRKLQTGTSPNYISLGRSLRQRDKELELWRELEVFGKVLSQRLSGGEVLGHFDFYSAILFGKMFTDPRSVKYLLFFVVFLFVGIAILLSIMTE